MKFLKSTWMKIFSQTWWCTTRFSIRPTSIFVIYILDFLLFIFLIFLDFFILFSSNYLHLYMIQNLPYWISSKYSVIFTKDRSDYIIYIHSFFVLNNFDLVSQVKISCLVQTKTLYEKHAKLLLSVSDQVTMVRLKAVGTQGYITLPTFV